VQVLWKVRMAGPKKVQVGFPVKSNESQRRGGDGGEGKEWGCIVLSKQGYPGGESRCYATLPDNCLFLTNGGSFRNQKGRNNV